MGKGDKQRANREAKKLKASKKPAAVTSTFLRPQADVRKADAKTPSR